MDLLGVRMPDAGPFDLRARAAQALGGLLTAAICAAGAAAQDVPSQAAFEVVAAEAADEKSVFATVESVNVIAARARIGGTVATLSVDEGDRVEAGQTVAVVASGTLGLQIEGVAARIEALGAQATQAGIDLARAEDLAARGVLPRARLDEARTAAAVVNRQLDEARAERDVLVEQVSEGAVLAPAAGRVLSVPLTLGAVVLPGEPVADIAAENYVLRLSLPERHARFVAEGDEVRVDAAALADEPEAGAGRFARIVQVYPRIRDGRVVADASVEGLGDFFVGERVRVWVSTEARRSLSVPRRFVRNRHGLDFVRVRASDGGVFEARVQLGRSEVDGAAELVELLSGVAPGDVLLAWETDAAEAAAAP
jgi:RND family efflux transporter MFP subunit